MATRVTRLAHPPRLTAVIALLLSAAVAAPFQTAWPQAVISHQAAGRILTVEKVAVNDGVVSGEVSNRSSQLVRDVQLFIRHTWLWDDETHPGKSDPGTSAYYLLQKEIAAGGRLAFRFEPSPPLPKVAGGRFETAVSIAGFTEVTPQSR